MYVDCGEIKDESFQLHELQELHIYFNKFSQKYKLFWTKFRIHITD